MEIGEIKEVSFTDYPGKICAVFYVLGCNFRCPWCFVPQFVLPELIKKQKKISEKEIFDFLRKKRKILDGVCVSGGEPTIHLDLPDFLRKIKKMNLLIKLDTNGSNPEMLKELIDKKLVDYISLDIKAPKDKYLEVVGVFRNGLEGDFLQEKVIKNIEKSFKILKEGKIDYEFKTVLVPGFLGKKEVLEIVKWIEGGKRYRLQNFRPERTIDPRFEKMPPFPLEYLAYIKKAIAPFFEFCEVSP